VPPKPIAPLRDSPALFPGHARPWADNWASGRRLAWGRGHQPGPGPPPFPLCRAPLRLPSQRQRSSCGAGGGDRAAEEEGEGQLDLPSNLRLSWLVAPMLSAQPHFTGIALHPQ
jgi:hypothetical protein